MAMTKESKIVPVFDTRGYVRTLTRGGSFSEEQANANADGLQEALSGVATKADIRDVRGEIRDMRGEIRELRGEIRVLESHIKLLEKRMDVQFQAMQEQMRGLRQLMVVGFSVIAIVVGAATLLSGLS